MDKVPGRRGTHCPHIWPRIGKEGTTGICRLTFLDVWCHFYAFSHSPAGPPEARFYRIFGAPALVLALWLLSACCWDSFVAPLLVQLVVAAVFRSCRRFPLAFSSVPLSWAWMVRCVVARIKCRVLASSGSWTQHRVGGDTVPASKSFRAADVVCMFCPNCCGLVSLCP